MNVIPEVINNYNIYDDSANLLIGVSGEVELPDFEAITDTLEGAGILGEIEDPVTGQFSSMKLKIPFSVLYESQFKIMDTTKGAQLTLRGSMQVLDTSTAGTDYVPVRIVVRGKAATSKMGKVQKGKKMEPEVEIEVFYIKIEVNSKTVIELDKLNFKYVLNGKDMLEKIRKQC